MTDRDKINKFKMTHMHKKNGVYKQKEFFQCFVRSRIGANGHLNI
jgi:hypothetical protein